jgi:hypothetical protein
LNPGQWTFRRTSSKSVLVFGGDDGSLCNRLRHKNALFLQPHQKGMALALQTHHNRTRFVL